MRFISHVRSSALLLVPATATLFLILSGSFAQAEITYTGTDIDIKVSDPVDVGNSLYAITLTALGENSYLPNSFDSTRSGLGGTGITTGVAGVDDKLHQVGIPPFLYTPTNTPNMAPLIDTHFLIGPPAYIAGTILPTETMNVASTIPGDTDGWFGNSLTGVFSLSGIPTSSSWDFARLVLPMGTLVNLDFKVGAILGEGSVREEFIHSFTVVVPEPGTLVMLCTCGMGLLVYLWRRRRSC